MEQIITSLQEGLVTIILTLVSVIVSVVALSSKTLIAYGNDWLKTHLTLRQRQALNKIASEAFAYVEDSGLLLKGAAKFEAAFDYALEVVNRKGLKITEDEIKAAIRQSCIEFNKDK